MPERLGTKRTPSARREAEPSGSGDYVELHCKTNFSFLEGASHPDELVERSAELGYRGLAITDRASLAGVVRAHTAAKEAGLPLLIGAQLDPVDAPSVVVWVTDRAAYGRLSRLLTTGRRNAEKGHCRLSLADVAEHADGLLAGALLRSLPSEDEEVFRSLGRWREVFNDRLYAVAELSRGAEDERTLERFMSIARQAHLPLVAANDVHYHDASRAPLHDVLTAIRERTTVAHGGSQLLPNAERALSPIERMRELFARCPRAVTRTVEVASRCKFSLDELRYEYPEELCSPGETPSMRLRHLTWEGARQRYPQGPPPRIRELIEHELQLIDDLHYEAYFLTVWDLVRFARSRGILCQGRGSAANSAVCFCLGVTSVDPDRIDVLFERFVSRERDEAPDIDVDFEHERREEVLAYLYEKYGRERAGMTAEVITYRSRSAARDVGKALGLSADRLDALATSLDGYQEDDVAGRMAEAGVDPSSGLGRRLLYFMGQIRHFPRHLSQHVGGMVITRGPLCELVPIENAAMPGRTVIQWDKDDLDALGVLKVDCLSLGMLTAIRKCFALLERHHDRRWTLASVPAEDPAVYEMVSRADTIGVFQIESRAQMSMLPRLRPRCFYDLVIEVAIVRPGPIQGDMVHPYLRRRMGEEAVEYPNEAIRSVLEKTLGVPLFQEQAMRLAVVAAGFTPGEADQLRRAMGAWRRPGVIEQFRKKLIDGMAERGLTADFAERVFHQIRGFGEYGFPESHAASFALLVYVSAWLKRHYPAAFAAAIINSQPMGFYAPAQILRDAREHGVSVQPIDVNASEWDLTLEPTSEGSSESAPAEKAMAIRLGFRLISGLSAAAVEKLVAARAAGGPFRSVEDLARRTGFSQAVLSRLARADAFSSLSLHRRAALWNALASEAPLPLFENVAPTADDQAPLPIMDSFDEVIADYRTVGVSLKNHPIQFSRSRLNELGVTPSRSLEKGASGSVVRVAGIVLMRQRPATAKGIRFVTLEDETGVCNLVVRPDVWDRYRRPAAMAAALLATGVLERKQEVIHIVVRQIEDLSAVLGGLRPKSRDFR